MKKKIPIGYEDFREIMESGLYYVDKTQMIKELLDSRAKVNLFTRPRRFGKTLNLSMIRRFFEAEMDKEGNLIDNSHLFDGLKISTCGEAYLAHQQQYPVISLTLKSAKQPDYDLAHAMLKQEIASEYSRHVYLLDSDKLTEKEKGRYQGILNLADDPALYVNALEFLSQCLALYHGKKAIILIDEYDVPLENAWFAGFYEEMISFIRSLFESALKTNPFLEFAVITGCLRISRESIFTGLNNLKIYSILSPAHGSSFGFTEKEVQDMLHYYGLEDKYEDVRHWYDGYIFGKQEIYNPWSILNYVDDLLVDREAFARPYWSNTSSNSIVRDLVENAGLDTKGEIESLIAGGFIEKPVREEVTYGDVHSSMDNLWNFLYFTGYLKQTGKCQVGESIYLKLEIPNAEIRSIYENTILAWFDQRIKKSDLSPLFQAMETGDCDNMAALLTEQLLETISFYDYAEHYYHGFLTGLLKSWGTYRVLSNRESGTGRPDILLKTPYIRKGRAMILELKVADSYQNMESCCESALRQIEERDYEAALREEGYQDIVKYGICFYRKECLIML